MAITSGRIYALCDPVTLQSRYVGQTVMPLLHRLNGHRYAAKAGARTPVCEWIRNLGRDPVIVLLQDDVPLGDLPACEQRWIREGGSDLNVLYTGRAGGDRLTDAGRERIAAAWRGRRHSDATRDKMRVAHEGKPGRPHTAETRAKIRESWKNRKPISDETRQKMSDAQRRRYTKAANS